MKKISLFVIASLIIMLSIIGYGYYKYKNKKVNVDITPTNTFIIDDNNNTNDEETYSDDNPIQLGLYKNYKDGNGRKLINNYSDNWTYHNDISSFEVYYTKTDVLENLSQIELFNKYKNEYQNIDNYKIGYMIEFATDEKSFKNTIISPKDTEELFSFLEVYLYDDYHRNGGWYSHTTESDYTDETILTSIKLTAGNNIEKITSDISLTAFTYDSDDFDENGFYRGNSSYTITIKKGE